MEQGKSIFGRKVITIILAIVIVAAGSFYYYSNYYHKNSASQQSSNLPEGWSSYQATKYGFQFIYPKSWGTPTVSSTDMQVGKSYDIAFSQPTKSVGGKQLVATTPNQSTLATQKTITISMESNDAAQKSCSKAGQCSTSQAVTKGTIQKILNGTDSNYQKLDSSSYAVYLAPKGTFTGGVIIYREVNIPKINVSAAKASYSILYGKSFCAKGVSQNQNCVTQSVLGTLQQVLKSFASI